MCIEERVEGVRQGTVVVVDPRVVREERLREQRLEVRARPDSTLHPCYVHKAIKEHRVRIEERNEGIRQGKVACIT